MASFGGFGTFGQSKPATTNAFGQPAAATSAPQGQTNIFGTQAPAAQPSGSIFGATASNQPATTQSNGFGGANMFGGTNTTSATQPNTNLFGTNNATATNTQPSTNLFGTAAPAASGGLFGSTLGTHNQVQNQQQQPATSTMFGGFGGASTSAAPAAASLFGAQPQSNTNSNNLFGASTQQQPLQSNALSFGASTVAQAPPAASGSSIEATIQSIHDAWNPASPQCQFHHFFYNLVDPADVQKYSRPPNASEALWQKAQRENPNSSRLVPVLAVGFDDLKKRVQAQKAQTEAQLAGMQILRKELDKMSENHTLRVKPRVSELSRAQVELTHRLTKLIHHLHLFIPSVRSTSIRPEEEALRARLEAIEAELRRPGGLGRVGGRIGELWGLVGRVRAQREAGKMVGGEREASWAVADSGAFDEIKRILFDEQQGLKYLTDVLRTALNDMSLIQSGQVGASRAA